MGLYTLSLFSGAGGLDEGFHQGGFRTILAIDIDTAAIESVRANFPSTRAEVRDLREEETVDLIIKEMEKHFDHDKRGLFGVLGGPPCQGFSVMNASSSPNDHRNSLVFRYGDILKRLKRLFDLDFFVFENVPALVGPKYRAHWEQAQHIFREAGFRIQSEVLDSVDFGVPQFRKRVFIVGINEKHGIEFDFTKLNDFHLPQRNVGDVLRNVPPLSAEHNWQRLDVHPNHKCMVPRSSRLAQIEPGDTKRKSFKRLSWDEPSPTVAYGHNEVHIHPAKGTQDRRLSAYEALLLQGFDRSFVLRGTMSDWHRLVSEAVSPPVAKTIARSLLSQLLCTETGQTKESKS